MTVGIVAEYNPFHNGHKMQIDYAKNVLKADHIVVAMSGNFTQRGEITCFDKYTRAEAALRSGVDIVFELPTIFATASAKEFASSGIALLASTSVVDTILFGAECDDKKLFIECAKKIIELEKNDAFNKALRNNLALGQNYAEARYNALNNYIPSEIITKPNNILGLEYCRYIIENNLNIDIEILKRAGNDYNNTILTGEISSASAIRSHLTKTDEITAVPKELLSLYNNKPYLSVDDISEIMHYKLISTADFNNILDCNKDLSKRIRNNLDKYISFSQFCELIKTKNNTYSKISRVLCHILLGITEKDFKESKTSNYISYLRMLGFSKNGSSLLSTIKTNSITKIITTADESINKYDIISSDIYRVILTTKTNKTYPNEYTKKFELANI